jgi:SH3 domain-containing YSC84-like protein 1
MCSSLFKSPRRAHFLFVLCIVAAVIRPATAEDTAKRVERATEVLDKMTSSGHGTLRERLATADCVAIIPGFKKGAAVVGVGFGRGFISCHNGDKWSAPGAVTLEGSSLGVQIGGEEIDIVMVSLDPGRRSNLPSDRFTIGTDASAAWGNGKSAHEDPNAKVWFFGHTNGVFAGFGLDGATLKPDDSGIKALYGKATLNSEIIEGATTPDVAKPLIEKLTSFAGAH